MLRTSLCVVYFLVLMLLSLLVYIPYYILYLIGPAGSHDRFFHRAARLWCRLTLWGVGAKVEVHGLEHLPPGDKMCFISNHQGHGDIPVIISRIPKDMGFVAKEELDRIPLFRTHMRKIHCVFIDRSTKRRSAEAIKQGIENIRGGHPMVIFPEGTTSNGRTMRPFLPGSFKLALRSQAVIVPLTVDGSYHLLEEKHKICAGRVKLTVHPPIDLKDLDAEEKERLPEVVHGIIQSALHRGVRLE